MLPRASRLHLSHEFRATVKDGVRGSGPGVVVHIRAGADMHSRAGFIVSKAVGNAVTRNRVKRQLRHQMAVELGQTPSVVDVVVRALPEAASSVAKDGLSRALASGYARLTPVSADSPEVAAGPVAETQSIPTKDVRA